MNLGIGHLHEVGIHAGRRVVERKLLERNVPIVELNVRHESVVVGQPVSFARVKYLLYTPYTSRHHHRQWRRQAGGGGSFPPMGGRPKIM